MKFNEQTDRMKALIIMGMIHDLAKLSMPKIDNINERLKEVGMEIVSSEYIVHVEDRLKDADAIMGSRERTIKSLEREVADLRGKALDLKRDLHTLCGTAELKFDSVTGLRQSIHLLLCDYQFVS